MKRTILEPQHDIRRQMPVGERSSTGEATFVNTIDLKPNNPQVDGPEMCDVPTTPIHRK